MVIYIVVGIFILFDVLTGLLSAMQKGDVNSTALRKGLFHKMGECLTVGGAWLLERLTGYLDLSFEIPLLKTVCIYICIMELVSILENIATISPGLAKLLSPYLDKLKDKQNNEEDHTDENGN